MLQSLSKTIERHLKMAEVRGILKYYLALGQTITYLELAKPLGMFSGGSELATILGDLMEQDVEAKRPILSSLVVRSDTRRPGVGYFEMARCLELPLGPSASDEEDFWQKQAALLGVTP